MLRISWQTLRARRGTLAGAFVAIWLAVTLAYATGVRVTGGIDSLTLDFHHRRQGGYSVHC